MPKVDLTNPGVQLHPHPTFEDRKANFAHLPDLNLRFAFVGTSGSGKGVAMLDLLLRHYRGVFDRIYLYSKSATIDRNWDPLRKYVEKTLGVDQKEEKTFFDEFDPEALQPCSHMTSKGDGIPHLQELVLCAESLQPCIQKSPTDD